MEQTDLFPPPPPEDLARPIGTIDGPARWEEGFGAGLRCWCGPAIGWRDLGDIKSLVGCLVLHRGRLSIGMSFDLGPHSIRRSARSEDASSIDTSSHETDDAA